MYDVVIIGGGAAGLGAALYCARYKLKTLLIGKELGGTGNEAHIVENWLGEKKISGIELMKKFIEHVKSYDVVIKEERVVKVEGDFNVFTEKNKYSGRTLIFATGMRHRKLDVKGEKELSGVSYCYTCDAAMFRNKVVCVVGGSDAACMGALLLSEYCKKVYIIYRGEEIRSEPITKEKVLKNKKIEILNKSNIAEILGDKRVEGIALGSGKKLKLSGIFIEIGADPNSELAERLGVKVNENGFIVVRNDQSTNIKGVFAAGDVTEKCILKQFLTCATEGSMAAFSVYKFLKKK